MAELNRSAASLRIAGDSLVPREISQLLSGQPTFAHSKGEEIRRGKTGRVRIARTGQWHLEAERREPADVDGQVDEILSQLTSDLDVWASLTSRYEVDLFCGWFMDGPDEGITLSPATLSALGARGIELAVCLYA